MPKRTCSIEGCEKAVSGRGWCAMHYSRWKRHGDPLERPGRTYPLRQQVSYKWLHVWLNKTFPRAKRCEHCGKAGHTHYASIGHTYTRNRDDWLELCAKCHLAFDGGKSPEQIAKQKAKVTGLKASAETRAKMRASSPETQKTHCKYGHAFDERNTSFTSGGHRICLRCRREWKAEKRLGQR